MLAAAAFIYAVLQTLGIETDHYLPLGKVSIALDT